ncbi:hypothetical protein KI387_000145, partial [Taxus chinensis]
LIQPEEIGSHRYYTRRRALIDRQQSSIRQPENMADRNDRADRAEIPHNDRDQDNAEVLHALRDLRVGQRQSNDYSTLNEGPLLFLAVWIDHVQNHFSVRQLQTVLCIG